MDNANDSDVFVIRDVETLKLMIDPLRSQICDLLAREELSPKEIAERLGLATSKLYYHLMLLEKHGVIKVVGTRSIANLLEKVYKKTAPMTDVDPALLSFSSREGHELLQSLITSNLTTTRDDIIRSFQARMFNLEQGAELKSRRFFINRLSRRLTEEQAAELREHLAEVETMMVEFDRQNQENGTADTQLYALMSVLYPSFYFELPAPEESQV